MPDEQLRRMSSFTALPPVEQVQLAGGPTYSYVRQGSEVWDALHRGRLTTSRFKDACGLREPSAARIVGGPQFPEAGVLKAYTHLLQPLWEPPPLQPRPAPPAPTLQAEAAAGPGAAGAGAGQQQGSGCGAPAVSDALAANEEARRAYNLQLAQGPQGTIMWDAAGKRQVSEAVALAAATSSGSGSMRLMWGSVQEAAALATLAVLLPGSQLHEVGLLCWDDTLAWGLGPDRQLPPLGASPDGLITHRVPVTHAQLQDARRALHGGSGLGPVPRSTAAAAALQLLRSSLELHTAALAQRAVGLAQPTAEGQGQGSSSGPQPPQQQQLSHPPAACVGFDAPLHASGRNQAPLEWLTERLLQPPAAAGLAQPAAVAGSAEDKAAAVVVGGGSSSGSGQDEAVAAVLAVTEVVEVKNHCPFLFKSQRKAKQRGVNVTYVQNDRGPVSGVWPLWVPQLQAHMAAAGAFSGLLLSRSPTRGVRLFRMYRDDSYVSSMLGIVSDLQREFVLPRRPPGPDPWAGRREARLLLRATADVAGAANVVVQTNAPLPVPGLDPDAFLRI